MPQIINENSAGGNIGSAFGSGLSSGLQQLAQTKLHQISQRNQQRKTASGLESLGIPKEQASQISGLPQELIGQYLKNRSQENQNNLFSKAFAGAQGTSEQANDLASLLQGLNPQNARIVAEQQNKNRQFGQQIKQSEIANDLKRQQLGQRSHEFTQSQGLKGQQLEQAKETKSFSETKDLRNEIVRGARSAKDSNDRLHRVEQLNNSGKLRHPLKYEIAKALGIDWDALKNADTQELEKLSVGFLNDAKNVFGGRLTNYDVETFLKGIPTLSQTKEGRERIIKNMRIVNKGYIEREKIMRDIIKKNKDIPPLDLNEQIEESLAPMLDKLDIPRNKNSFGPNVDAALYTNGSEWQEPSGDIFVVKNAKWEPKG